MVMSFAPDPIIIRPSTRRAFGPAKHVRRAGATTGATGLNMACRGLSGLSGFGGAL